MILQEIALKVVSDELYLRNFINGSEYAKLRKLKVEERWGEYINRLNALNFIISFGAVHPDMGMCKVSVKSTPFNNHNPQYHLSLFAYTVELRDVFFKLLKHRVLNTEETDRLHKYRQAGEWRIYYNILRKTKGLMISPLDTMNIEARDLVQIEITVEHEQVKADIPKNKNGCKSIW